MPSESESRLPALETDRLVLRGLRIEDAAVQRVLWTERDERVPAHRRIDADGRPTTAELAAQIESGALTAGPGLLTVERKDTGDAVGYCGLVVQSGGTPDEPELAFELLRTVHGSGYATEAARAVVAWSESAGFTRLRATVWDWNLASRRVLDKLGFRETGEVNRVSEHGRSLVTVRERR